MQNIGPKDLFLQMLGWKKYILCLRRETGVIFLKLRHAKPLPTVAADSAGVRNVKILMWLSVTRLSISQNTYIHDSTQRLEYPTKLMKEKATLYSSISETPWRH